MEFNVFREQIRDRKNLEKLICKYWNAENIIYRGGHGVILNSAASISDGFQMTHSAYCKLTELLVHSFSIVFDIGMQENYILETVEKIKEYLSDEYQLIYMIAQNDCGRIEAGFIINSVSYRTGKNFYDNNSAYIELAQLLNSIVGIKCDIKFGSNVLFKAKGSNMCCYVRKDLDNGI